ncbi:MAG: hypothetical protein LIO87_04750 [Eubacterium sp.]|nr:hypothetical protein [Eubacterium sp.]
MKKIYLTLALISILFWLAFALTPKGVFSENENRYLASFPKLSQKTLTDGSFTEGLTDFITDGFPFRDFFMGLNTAYNKYVLKKTEINGIYFADDDYYIEKYSEPENTEEISEKLNAFFEKIPNTKSFLALAPTAVTIYNHKLPPYAEETSQPDEIAKYYSETSAVTVDLCTPLSQNSDKKLFYRLDHHWTTEGAYYAYLSIAEKMGLSPLEKSQCGLTTVTEDFRGTIFSKLNMNNLKGESIEILKTEYPLTVYYTDTDTATDTLYNLDYTAQKDKYSLFLDNIHPLTEITCPEAETDRTLAVVKDSYANCLIPFLTKHFQKIYVFDPRYYKGSISDFINENQVSDVLVLYNMNTIDNDLGIRAIY